MISRPCYCTREDVRAATDQQDGARFSPNLDRAIEAGSDAVEALLRRVFWPWTGTRTFDWPNDSSAPSWRLWLDEQELLSVSALDSGGTALTDYLLRPDAGPPYSYLELDTSVTSGWSAGGSAQRSISVTGTWGYTDDQTPAGVLAEALDASETAVDVSNGTAVGVGDVLVCGTERMLVTDRTWLSTGQTLQTPVTAQAGATALVVTSGSAFALGEQLLLDSERMTVVDIATNTLVVKRARGGSALAAHSGSTIYADRTLTVERGHGGTAATTHADGSVLTRWVYPALVRRLAVAEAVSALQDESSGYARQAGSGDAAREQIGIGLDALRSYAQRSHGRQLRVRAV